MDKFVSYNTVRKTLKIHRQTLYRMEQRGEIDVIWVGNKRMYNLNKFLNQYNIINSDRKKICYCRVSSRKQKADLDRQINYMQANYKEYLIISDIGSGLNMNRSGLRRIIDLAINGEIDELVITYKDRLARFGYDLIEHIIKNYSNGKIVIINNNQIQTANEEHVKDTIYIMNVYTAKINGSRKIKKLK